MTSKAKIYDYSAKKDGSKGSLWRTNSRVIEPVSYGALDADKLRLAVDIATRAGAAIMLGITQDGGAYSVCVLHGNEKLKEYPHSVAEMDRLLGDICEEFV